MGERKDKVRCNLLNGEGGFIISIPKYKQQVQWTNHPPRKWGQAQRVQIIYQWENALKMYRLGSKNALRVKHHSQSLLVMRKKSRNNDTTQSSTLHKTRLTKFANKQPSSLKSNYGCIRARFVHWGCQWEDTFAHRE